MVRITSADDAPELARLNHEFNGVDEPYQQLALRLADPRRVDQALLTEVDGRAVGFAGLRVVPCVFYKEPYAELTELYVQLDHRRRGVGRMLAEKALELARQAGAGHMLMLVGRDNQTAGLFYKSLGFIDDDAAMCIRLR